MAWGVFIVMHVCLFAVKTRGTIACNGVLTVASTVTECGTNWYIA